MKIVVIGGTGLIGSIVVANLAEHGHDAVAAAPSTGVNSITGQGLAEALHGAEVLVDVSNSPSFADDDVLDFFLTSTGNLVKAATEAGVGHYVALSVVGVDRAPEIGYYRAKVAQEKAIAAAGLAYSVVRATQFLEFAGAIADTATSDGVVRLPGVSVRPMAAVEVAGAVAGVAVGEPVGGVVEVGGPEMFGLDEWVRRVLTARSDPREVVTDPTAPFFGGIPAQTSLLPGADASIGRTTLSDWLACEAKR